MLFKLKLKKSKEGEIAICLFASSVLLMQREKTEECGRD